MKYSSTGLFVLSALIADAILIPKYDKSPNITESAIFEGESESMYIPVASIAAHSNVHFSFKIDIFAFPSSSSGSFDGISDSPSAAGVHSMAMVKNTTLVDSQFPVHSD